MLRKIAIGLIVATSVAAAFAPVSASAGHFGGGHGGGHFGGGHGGGQQGPFGGLNKGPAGNGPFGHVGGGHGGGGNHFAHGGGRVRGNGFRGGFYGASAFYAGGDDCLQRRIIETEDGAFARTVNVCD